jgi:hypothetical protein
MQCAAMLGPAAALLAAASPLASGSASLAVAFITVGMGLSALSSSEAPPPGAGVPGRVLCNGCAAARAPHCQPPAPLPSCLQPPASFFSPAPPSPLPLSPHPTP